MPDLAEKVTGFLHTFAPKRAKHKRGPMTEYEREFKSAIESAKLSTVESSEAPIIPSKAEFENLDRSGLERVRL